MTSVYVADEVIQELAHSLGGCRDVNEGRRVFEAATRIVKTRQDWARLQRAYGRAPKLMLKEATAARRLYELQTYVDTMLARRAAPPASASSQPSSASK